MTTIADMGEDALIALFAPRLPLSDAAILGPGDDAAVLSVDGDLVVSSDVLVEGRHFRLDWSSPEDVGWRAAMQNLADIDAMGAVPTALQVTLAAPGSTDVDWVLGFVDGLREACTPHGVGVVGGDLSGANEIHVGVTVMGETHGVDPVTRADAAAGDLVAVSGALGASAAGLAQLERGVRHDADAIALFLRPHPRIGAGIEAALRGATAMMDVSDGLLRDAHRIARASQVGIAIESFAVPIHAGALNTAVALGVDPMMYALTGGEDHALLATFPSRAAVPAGWFVIGRVESSFRGVKVDDEVPGSLGWDHFGA